MKNIIKGALLLLTFVGIVSCNLDKYPSDSIPARNGFKNFQDAEDFRTGIYGFARSCFPADAFLAPGFQTEGTNPTKDYGNFYGFQYNWTFDDSEQFVQGLWASSYSAIFEINYFLEKVETLDVTKMTADQLNKLELYKGEAHFFRAMINLQLTDFYCKDYTPETANTDWGIILAKVADIFAREKRSTLFETYEFINEDIAIAKTALDTYYGSETSRGVEFYVSPMTLKALTAKVLLNTHKYTEAAVLAAQITDAYPLISSLSDFRSFWRNDKGTEVVFQFFANLNEGAQPYGEMFLKDTYGTRGTEVNPSYLPDQWILDQYDARDIRKPVYFAIQNIRIGISKYTDLYVVTKYPGNPAYNANPNTNALSHNVRPYRSADFCLIAAEAYAKANDLGNANAYLKKLLTARMTMPNTSYTYVDYTSIEEIMPIIKLERLKELFMESNRIADLKRWGDPMSRAAHNPQNTNPIFVANSNLVVSASDQRFVWPIPQTEQDSNPSIQGQLNWK